MVNSILRRALPVIFWAAGLFLLSVVLLVLGAVAGQWRRGREFEKKLQPSIAWVESYEKSHQRLPTLEEFRSRPGAEKGDNAGTWLETDGFWNCPDKPTANRNARSFCVQIWRGEDTLHYHSWNREYVIVEP